ncbi:MAG: helix-turn-helix transcriptional regulator [Methanosarcinaceae archaeon]
MNLRFYIICIAAALMFAAPATAADSPATIHGVVYGWDTFEPLDNAVVEVNSIPSQSMVAKYGVYSFELAPGAYTIKAGYYQNGTLSYSAEEPITVESEGNYVLDLLLLPVYSEELMDSQSSGTGELSEIPVTETESQSSGLETAEPDSASESEANSESESEVDTEEDGISARESSASASSSLNTTHLFAAFMLILLLVGGYQFSLKQKSGEKKPAAEEKAGERQIHSRVSVTSPAPEPAVGQTAKLETKAAAEKAPKPDEKTAAEPAVKPITEPESEIHENTEGSAEEPGEEPAEKSEEKEDTSTPKKPLPLPADLQEIMDIIRGQGGRITQKELRSRLKYSEGKVSLMLTDLERRGLVEKFKRGRGNVVIIKDGKR